MSSVSAASGPYAAELSASRPKIGNAGDGADVLGALLAGGQRPAEEQILNARSNCHK